MYEILLLHASREECSLCCVKMHVFQEQQRLKALDDEFHRKLAIEMKKVISHCLFSVIKSVLISLHKYLVLFAFSALTLLVGHQEEHPACEN